MVDIIQSLGSISFILSDVSTWFEKIKFIQYSKKHSLQSYLNL